MLQAQINRRHQPARICGVRTRGQVMSPFGVFDAARTAVRMIGRAAKVQAYEVALMASLAAMAPLHLVGGGFDPSCGPRSPVQAHTAPTTRPVLLVRGPLHRIPIALKDSYETEAVLTTRHAHLRADYVPAIDAETVRRLKTGG